MLADLHVSHLSHSRERNRLSVAIPQLSGALLCTPKLTHLDQLDRARQGGSHKATSHSREVDLPQSRVLAWRSWHHVHEGRVRGEDDSVHKGDTELRINNDRQLGTHHGAHHTFEETGDLILATLPAVLILPVS